MTKRGALAAGVMVAALALAGVAATSGARDGAEAASGATRSAVAAPVAAPSPATVAALDSARARLAERLGRPPEALALRALVAHPQADPATLAVCGQVNPSARADTAFWPFVAVLRTADAAPAVADLFVGASPAEASRVYIELVDRCREDGGPPANARGGPRPIPPLPTGAGLGASASPAPATPPAPASAVAPAANAAAAAASAPSETVTTTARHGVNLRTGPGGEVVRTVPRSTTLRVFARGPGGWVRVGEGDAPSGWVHASMLDRPT